MRSVVSAFAFSAEHGQDGDSRRDWQDGLAALAVLQGHKSGQCPHCGKECGGKAHTCNQAWAKKHGLTAVGLFLGDGDSVNVTQLDEELGHVGFAQPGSPALINTLLAGGYMPVVSSIGVTDKGELMNVNADQAATALAATLGADLILLSDVSGILDGKGQRIAEMTAEKAEQLIEQGIITDGMIVKVNAALDAARTLGRPVDIASWRHAEQLPALFNGTPIGTRILA